MFIPLHDANQLRHIRFQYVTLGLIIANILIYFGTVLGVSEETAWADALGLGYIPAVINDIAQLSPEHILVPESFTYVTYSFLHADIFHLGGNMLFLWVFGDNVEDSLGHIKFLIFYLACAAAGAFLHGVILPDSQAPLIGASGAIAGIVSAYLILHPRVKLWVLVLMRIPLRIPAWIPLILWVGFQFMMLFVQTEDAVSWPAHVGGIVAGAVLVLFLRRSGVPLFDRNLEVGTAVPVPSITPHEAPEPVTPPSKWGRPT
jgi:membrane associated rhomboid family serine protease